MAVYLNCHWLFLLCLADRRMIESTLCKIDLVRQPGELIARVRYFTLNKVIERSY